MEAFGIITLILTVFMLIFYAYHDKHGERDVSFFLSVGLISLVMNLFTNAGGIFELCYLYLVLAVAGLALGFAVSVKETVGFYTSIGPWFKETFTDTALIGWKILSFLCCPAGIVLYFVWYRTKPEMAKICGKCGIWGVLLWILLIWAILGLAL